MRITTTIQYEAGYTGRDTVGIHKGCFYEEATFEIEEVTGGDAPVATRIGDLVTRWHGGRHYAPLAVCDGATPMSTAETAEALADCPGHVHRGYTCFNHLHRPVMFSADRYRWFDGAARAKAQEEAREAFSSLILIDGGFWARCAEPYMLRREKEEEWHPGDPGEPSLEIPVRGGGSQRRYHRYHSWLLNLRVDRADTPGAAGHIEVILPESIRRDPERDTLIDAAIFLLDDYSHRPLGEVHPDILATLTALSRILWERGEADADPDRTEEAVTATLEAIAARETDTRLRDPGRLESYRACLRRWQDRTLSLSELVPSAGPPL